MSSCVEITSSLTTNCQWGGSTIFCFSTRSSPSVTWRTSVADSDRGMFRWTHCWNFCFVTGGPPVPSLSRFYRIVDIVIFSMWFTKQQILKQKKVKIRQYSKNVSLFRDNRHMRITTLKTIKAKHKGLLTIFVIKEFTIINFHITVFYCISHKFNI